MMTPQESRPARNGQRVSLMVTIASAVFSFMVGVVGAAIYYGGEIALQRDHRANVELHPDTDTRDRRRREAIEQRLMPVMQEIRALNEKLVDVREILKDIRADIRHWHGGPTPQQDRKPQKENGG